MSVAVTFGGKRRNDESECEEYRASNLRVQAPDDLFRKYDDESFDGPRGSFGGVVFNAQGHAIKFSRAQQATWADDEEPYNTCVANKKGYAPEFYDAWKVRDAHDDEFFAIEMEKYEITLFDFLRQPTNDSDDADVDASLAAVVTQMSHERACHYDMHFENIMLKRNINGHYIVKAIDWMSAEFGEKVCKRPFFFYEELETVLGSDAVERRFPLTRQSVLDRHAS
jgi:hypothetical protein